MAHIAVVLADHLLVHPAEVGVEIGLFGIPLRKLADDALEVGDTVAAREHGIVTKVLTLGTRVSVAALAAEPQTGILGKALDDDLVPVQLILLRGLQVGRLVTELDGPLVIVVDTRIEAGLGDVVLRLSNVVETGIVHNTDRVAVLLDPLLVAELLDRSLAAGAHIVAQAEGVANFVGRNEADEVAHQFLVIFHFTRARIDGTDLDLVPVVDQGHNIVVPADVALQDFAGTRIVDIRTVSIGGRGSQVTDNAETSVLHTHIRIVLRPFLSVDGILPAGLLEGDLPVVDTGNQVLTPLFRGRRVDVIDDRLDRLDQLAALLALDILRLGLQAPAGDVTHRLDTLLLVVEAAVTAGEVTDAGVEPTLLHRLLRQEDHRGVQHEGHGTGFAAGRESAGCAARSTGCTAGGRSTVIIGLGDRHFRIDRIGADALDIGRIGLQTAQVVGALGSAGETEHLQVSLEKAVGLDAGSTRRTALLRLERCHDRILGRYLDSLADRRTFIRHDGPGIHPELQVPVGTLLPVDHDLVDLLATVLGRTRRIGDIAGDGQNPAAEDFVRNVKIPVLVILGHAIQARLHSQDRRIVGGLSRLVAGSRSGSVPPRLREGSRCDGYEQGHHGA